MGPGTFVLMGAAAATIALAQPILFCYLKMSASDNMQAESQSSRHQNACCMSFWTIVQVASLFLFFGAFFGTQAIY